MKWTENATRHSSYTTRTTGTASGAARSSRMSMCTQRCSTRSASPCHKAVTGSACCPLSVMRPCRGQVAPATTPSSDNSAARSRSLTARGHCTNHPTPMRPCIGIALTAAASIREWSLAHLLMGEGAYSTWRLPEMPKLTPRGSPIARTTRLSWLTLPTSSQKS